MTLALELTLQPGSERDPGLGAAFAAWPRELARLRINERLVHIRLAVLVIQIAQVVIVIIRVVVIVVVDDHVLAHHIAAVHHADAAGGVKVRHDVAGGDGGGAVGGGVFDDAAVADSGGDDGDKTDRGLRRRDSANNGALSKA